VAVAAAAAAAAAALAAAAPAIDIAPLSGMDGHHHHHHHRLTFPDGLAGAAEAKPAVVLHKSTNRRKISGERGGATVLPRFHKLHGEQPCTHQTGEAAQLQRVYCRMNELTQHSGGCRNPGSNAYCARVCSCSYPCI
jgi:hypothetical protein